MVKQIIWTQSAKDDLQGIVMFNSNSEESNLRIKLLLSAIEKVSKFPLNVLKFNEIPNTDYYELKQSNYKVIVKSVEDNIYIMAIIHNLLTII